MNRKTLIGLVAAALIAIAIAIVVNHSNQPRSESGGEQAQYLVPALRDHVNDVNEIALVGAENKPIATIKRGADGWTIAEKGNFSADTAKLREFLLKLADAKLVEQKTASKDKYATLGVEAVDAKDAKSVEVDLGGLAQPVKLVVGNSNAHGGTFVRRAGEAQSWLASGAITIDKKPESWLRKDLIDVPATRIASVEITRPDGKMVRAMKASDGDANFTLEDIPKGREAGSAYTVNGLASAIGGLHFDDVVSAKDAMPPDHPLKAHFATFDGLAVDVTAWEKDGKDYAQFTAMDDADRAGKHIDAEQAKANADYEAQVSAAKNVSADASKATDAPKTADAKPATPEPAKPLAVSDPAKDREQKLTALDKEVTDLNTRFKDWTYVLPPYKYAAMNKSQDDLLKAPEEKKDDKKAAPKTSSPAKKKG